MEKEKKNTKPKKTIEEQLALLEKKKAKLQEKQNKEYRDLLDKFFDFVKRDSDVKQKLEKNIKNENFKEAIQEFIKTYKISSEAANE